MSELKCGQTTGMVWKLAAIWELTELLCLIPLKERDMIKVGGYGRNYCKRQKHIECARYSENVEYLNVKTDIQENWNERMLF